MSLLHTIVAATRRSVEARAAETPRAAVEAAARAHAPRGAAFTQALAAPGGLRVIAECKRRSPARGVLRAAYDPAAIAREYEEAGAAAISVLTEPTFFDGHSDHLAAVGEAVTIPVLCKDFIVDAYQLHEARALGADAVLLIVAALEPAVLRALADEARALDLATLVEVHDARELEIALAIEAPVIGVNNRNLQTLEVSVDTAERLIEAIPDGAVAVAESGLRTHETLVRLCELGYDAFLVGERFMTAPSPGEALRELIAPARPAAAAGSER